MTRETLDLCCRAEAALCQARWASFDLGLSLASARAMRDRLAAGKRRRPTPRDEPPASERRKGRLD